MVLNQAAPAHHRWRWTGAVALLLVAALLTPPALVGFWGRRTVVDAQRYLDTVGPLAQSPQIQAAVAERGDHRAPVARGRRRLPHREPAAPGGRLSPPRSQRRRRELRRVVGPEVPGERTSSTSSGLDVNEQVQEELRARRSNGDTTGAVQSGRRRSPQTCRSSSRPCDSGLVDRGSDDLREGDDPGHTPVARSSCSPPPSWPRRRTSGPTPTPSRAGCCRSSSCSTSAPSCWLPTADGCCSSPD